MDRTKVRKKAIVAITTGLISLMMLHLIGCGKAVKLEGMSAQALFTMGKEKYDKKKYIKAIECFQQIVFNHPGETIVDTAQFYLAMSYVGNKDWVLGEAEFNRLAINYPASPYFQYALFMKTNCLFESIPKHYGLDQEGLGKVISQLEDFIIDYPESDLLPQVRDVLSSARTRLARKTYESGVVYSRMGLFEPARTYFQKVIDEYTDTQYAADATFGLAESAYRQKKYDEARKKFADFQAVFPSHKLAERAAKYIAKIDKDHPAAVEQADNGQSP